MSGLRKVHGKPVMIDWQEQVRTEFVTMAECKKIKTSKGGFAKMLRFLFFCVVVLFLFVGFLFLEIPREVNRKKENYTELNRKVNELWEEYLQDKTNQ